MQCIAHCMHTYVDDNKVTAWAKQNLNGFVFSDEEGIYRIRHDNKEYNLNEAIFKFTSLAQEYKQAHTKLIDTAEYLESPHYLESYYILTNKISTVDFK